VCALNVSCGSDGGLGAQHAKEPCFGMIHNLCVYSFLCNLCFFHHPSYFSLFIIISLLYWWHIVTFTKVLTIYHSWIHPPHHSPLFSSPHSWNSFSRSHFSIFIHEYVIFPPHSPSYTLSLFPYIPPPAGTNLPDGTCFTFLFFVFEKRDFCLRQLHREFPCDIYIIYMTFILYIWHLYYI
jgi:hypothetical protein